jgi:Domain of unknown function (DUF4372)
MNHRTHLTHSEGGLAQGSPVNRFCSIFSQLLKLFPRLEFESLVKAHRGEHHAGGFTWWEQLVTMLFCRLR